MTIDTILAEVDEINPNTYDEQIKLGWLSKLDGRVFNDVILTHEHDKVLDDDNNLVEPTFTGYEEVSEETELIIPDTYSDVYRDYLMAMIAYANGESDRYANSMIMFNSNYQQYLNWYNRNHKPLQIPLKVF